MGTKTKNGKRPCRVCGKWFQPNARLGARQKTCGSPECQQKWHARKCREWNKQNRAYFREIYLEKRLASSQELANKPATEPTPHGRQVPTLVQEVMGRQQLVIIGYLLRLPPHRLQEVINCQPFEILKNRQQVPLKIPARGDCPGSCPAVS